MDLPSIFAPVAPQMKAVDKELVALMQRVGRQTAAARGSPGILERIVQHPFAVPGKRIRPALVLLAARVAGGAPDPDSLVALASAVEVLHAASLVHDDIIDGAEARRHQVSLNKRYGNRVAVLAGDILYTHFFSLITGLHRVDPVTRFALLDIFLDTTKSMCMGEIIAQETSASGRPLAWGEYLEIATDKTAVLFAACCRGAGLLCGAPRERQDALGDFGLDFGLAFQMADDLVDGDHGLDPGVPLEQRTREYAARAHAAAAGMPGSDARDSLSGLVDYVVAQARG
jgi:geranylgeranyl pyrophosphate synthase